MQTLGLSDSTPRTEGRLKSLFWPSIQTSSDVDYLGAQGYWVCTIVGLLTCILSAFTGHPIAGAVFFVFFYVGGVGVRERSRYAAAVVLLMYIADAVVGGHSVVKILIAAVLFSNLRATWIASSWKPDSDAAILPPRFGDTWSDKFADKLPPFLWPKIRVLYYVFSVALLVVTVAGIVMILRHRV
ncbi:MAG TPA: hypothetical protein VIH88_00865 [Candidatus Acidoferrales bacterium]